jgi:hypothetical protein
VDVLNDMVSRNNNTKHSSIKTFPVNASKPENIYRTYISLHGIIVHDNSSRPKYKLAVGDEICITKK